MKDYII
jgi:hypothetical protein